MSTTTPSIFSEVFDGINNTISNIRDQLLDTLDSFHDPINGIPHVTDGGPRTVNVYRDNDNDDNHRVDRFDDLNQDGYIIDGEAGDDPKYFGDSIQPFNLISSDDDPYFVTTEQVELLLDELDDSPNGVGSYDLGFYDMVVEKSFSEENSNMSYLNEIVLAHDGDDTVSGNDGFDILLGGKGRDSIRGGNDADIINGESGADTLKGDAGDDLIDGGRQNDLIYGSNGNDSIKGGLGVDTIFGGNGNDVLFGDHQIKQDDHQSPIHDWAWVYEIGNITTAGFRGSADSIKGGSGNDQIGGGEGNDTLKGESGNDTIWGDWGNDLIYGHDGNDKVYAGKGNDTIYGGNGEDTVSGFQGTNVLKGDGNTAYADTFLITNVSDNTIKDFQVFHDDLFIVLVEEQHVSVSTAGGDITLSWDYGAHDGSVIIENMSLSQYNNMDITFGGD